MSFYDNEYDSISLMIKCTFFHTGMLNELDIHLPSSTYIKDDGISFSFKWYKIDGVS